MSSLLLFSIRSQHQNDRRIPPPQGRRGSVLLLLLAIDEQQARENPINFNKDFLCREEYKRAPLWTVFVFHILVHPSLTASW